MNIILLGAPGAGKGTQAVKISEKYALPHISTGEILRSAIREKTAVGNLAKEFIDQGKLVPDDVVIEIVKERLKASDVSNGCILDGFPRTVYQAERIEKACEIDVVLNIQLEKQQILSRLSGRRVCPKCGESFHISMLNGNTKCKCNETLIQRDDDKEETILNRLSVYEAQTKPLIDYYTKKGLLKNVNGNAGSPELVFAEITAVLNNL